MKALSVLYEEANWLKGHTLHPWFPGYDEFPSDIDYMILWGGEDIWPGIYNQKPSYTHAAHLSKRDQVEIQAARIAISKGIPILGICRGAQLMCAMSGGELFQHIGNNHCRNHSLHTQNQTLITTSTHHQMMDPRGVEHDLIAWVPNMCPDYYKESKVEPPPVDYEIVYFPKTKSLCIQGHPEYVEEKHEFKQYTKKLIDEYLVV